MSELPTGTVTLLFTDVEGSTRLLQRAGDAYPGLLEAHRLLLRSVFERHGGVEVGTEGDAFFVAFPSAKDAVAAAGEAQQALAAHPWAEGHEIRVRIGIHTGEPRLVERNYVGLDVHRAARVMAAGHGGQVLLSQSTRDLLDEQFELRDLGQQRLKDLSEPQRLYQLRIEGLPDEFPALKTLEHRPTNLPVQPTPLVGRVRELAELQALIVREDVRLLTLTGPGGTGKTRLALQLAAELIERFPDGVWFVNLAAITDPQLLLPTVAQTVGVKEQGGQPLQQTLSAHLAHKQTLLLIDNFEQVIEAAPEIAELLQRTRSLTLVVTSRVALRVAAEHEYLAPPLADEEAVALFAERAQAAKHSFVLDGNRPLVAEICRRLDRLPLAIELAAARIKLLPERALLERLDQRLKLLSGGARDLPARQQTLRATIDWSYSLLDEPERRLFARLAVFAGGRNLEAIEAVCNPDGELDTLDILGSLIDKSLLRQEEGPEGKPRFVMLETIHEYAREKLEHSGESEQLRERHARFFATFLRDADDVHGPDERSAHSRLVAEIENVRAFAYWSLQHEPTLLLDSARGLVRVYRTRGQVGEGRRELEAAVAATTDAAPERQTEALLALATLAIDQGDFEAAERCVLEVLAGAAGQHAEQEARALTCLSVVALNRGDYESARSYGEEALAAARNSVDEYLAIPALLALATAIGEVEPESAATLLDEVVELACRLGDKHTEARALGNRAGIASYAGDHQLGRRLAEEAREIFREVDDEFNFVHATANVALFALFDGDSAAARPLLYESLRTFADWGIPVAINYALDGLAGIAALEGNGERAARLFGAAAGLRDRTGNALSPEEQTLTEPFVAQAREQIGEQAFERCFAEGQALPLGDAVSYALLPEAGETAP